MSFVTIDPSQKFYKKVAAMKCKTEQYRASTLFLFRNNFGTKYANDNR